MVILGDCGVKKKVSKTPIFELPKVKNCISKLCTNPLGDPPPPRPNTQIGWKPRKYGQKHALDSWDGHFRWLWCQKKSFQNFDFWAAQGEKLHKQVVYQSLGRPPPPPPT